MITICEGLDKCGKSTFIETITTIKDAHFCWCSDIFSGKPISVLDACLDSARKYTMPVKEIALHFGANDAKPFDSFMKCLELSRYCHVYLDRSFISELVYGRIFREKSRISFEEEQTIINELKRTPHCILYFKRRLSQEYFDALDKTDVFENSKSNTIRLNDEYNRVMRKYSKAGLNIYEISFDIKRS